MKFNNKDEFFEYLDLQQYGKSHLTHLKACFARVFKDREFKGILELQKYVQSYERGQKDIINTSRAYMRYLEQMGLMSDEWLVKYRSVLKMKRCRTDFYVPPNEEVIKNYNIVKDNKDLEIIYLVLTTSGIRLIECLEFLKNYDEEKFKKHEGFVSYNVSEMRNTKNINNIYLPMFVYEKLRRVNILYGNLRSRFKAKGCTFSLKYLRKWQYNFMLFNGVPESVADFIQGRSGKGVSANHYLAKSQQADYWYNKIIPKLIIIICQKQDAIINNQSYKNKREYNLKL